MIRELFLRVFNKYRTAKNEGFAEHPLAYFIRHDFPDVLRTHFQKHTDLIWKASAGQGGWADSSWIAIFNPLVTTTVQHGYYPVFFDKNLDNIYLSFNQGMTELREEFNDSQRGWTVEFDFGVSFDEKLSETAMQLLKKNDCVLLQKQILFNY